MGQRFLMRGTVGVGLVLFFGVAHVYGLSGFHASLWADGFWTVASLGAGLLCLKAGRLCVPDEKRAWFLFAAACLSWFAGILVWSYLELIHGNVTPFPAASDVFFMMFAPLFGLGLWAFPPRKGPIDAGRKRRLLDLGMIVSASFVIVVMAFYGTLLEQTEPTLYFAAALAYPVLYLPVAILALSRAWLFVWGRRRWVFAFLVAGLLVHALIDTVYAYQLLGRDYRAGNYIDVVWLLGFGFIAIAASDTIAERRDPASATTRPRPVGGTIVAAYEPMILLVTAVPMLVALLLFGETLDAASLPILVPVIGAFLLFAVAREILGRKVEARLLVQARAAAEKLAESEREAADLAKASSDRFWITDTDHKLVMLWGAGRSGEHFDDVLLGRTRWDVGGGDPDRDPLWKAHRETLEGHQPFRDFVYTVTLPNGRKRHVAISGVPYFDGAGLFLGYRGVSRDITAQVEAERALKESEAKWAGILTITADAIVVCDEAQKIVVFNQGAERLFGYAAEEVLGKDIGLLLPERFRAAHAGHVAGFGRGPEASRQMSDRREVYALHKDGTEFPARASISRLELGGGMLFTVILHDVTEQKQREWEVVRAKEAAEIANRAKSEFLANMSHELRTPLNAVIGFSEALESRVYGPVNDRQRHVIGDVLQAGHHLLDLINDILDLSKIEAGKFEPAFEEVDVTAAVAVAVRLIADRAEDARVEVVVAPMVDQPRLKADERLFKQMLINLLSNAVKFTGAGGRVTISVSPCDQGGMSVDVADNGIGMAGEEVQTALAAFGQVDGAMTRRHEGSGLGLPLVRSFMELHDGTLEIDSTPGGGTVARLVFPAERVV